ncbi:hypothetical protein AB0B42_29725, partial [Streptomyces fradiae]
AAEEITEIAIAVEPDPSPAATPKDAAPAASAKRDETPDAAAQDGTPDAAEDAEGAAEPKGSARGAAGDR